LVKDIFEELRYAFIKSEARPPKPDFIRIMADPPLAENTKPETNYDKFQIPILPILPNKSQFPNPKFWICLSRTNVRDDFGFILDFVVFSAFALCASADPPCIVFLCSIGGGFWIFNARHISLVMFYIDM